MTKLNVLIKNEMNKIKRSEQRIEILQSMKTSPDKCFFESLPHAEQMEILRNTELLKTMPDF